MPGYVQYFYKDGKLPSGTKSSFTNFGILTVHSLIVKNTLIFMHKISIFRKQLPHSVKDTIAHNAPTVNTNGFEECCEWLDNFGTQVYRNSLFYKGPLLYIDHKFDETRSPSACLSLNIFKKNVKNSLLKHQSSGEIDQWQADNFTLFNIAGLRKSARANGI